MMENAGQPKVHSNRRSNAEGEAKFIESIQEIVDDCQQHSYFEHIGEYVTRICNLAR